MLYFHVFLEKDHLPFSVQRKNIIFFIDQIIQERSYSSAIFLERPSFQNIWKIEIWFFVQCIFVPQSYVCCNRTFYIFSVQVFLQILTKDIFSDTDPSNVDVFYERYNPSFQKYSSKDLLINLLTKTVITILNR